MEPPLAGIRVLDFSRVLSGPFCGRALADLGADVIKVEPPQGDLTRFAHPRRNSLALYFVQQNAGKRNVSLDLRHPEAAPLLLRLARTCDVVLENFRPGVMDRMGLGYEAVAAVNPSVVYASITGYGQTGPWAQRRAYAVVVHAEAGMTAGSLARGDGTRRNEPFSHADVYAGLEALAGILAALLQRHRTGRGQHIDVAMAHALLTVNEHVQDELDDTDAGDAVTSMGPGGSPIFELADGALVTVAGDPCARGTFELYAEVMGRPELVDDPRFATVGDRRRHREELIAEIQSWTATFTDPGELEDALGRARLAMGVVRDVSAIAASDWAAHRGAIVEVSDRGEGAIRIPDAPWRFSDARAGVAGPPAYRGEHNREVFGELGLDGPELDRLEATGVLSSRPPRQAAPGPPGQDQAERKSS